MKANHLLCLLSACLSLSARADEPAKLDVHEWGTFTVLSGSDGAPLPWHDGLVLLDEVPPFVQINPWGGKRSAGPTGSTTRMETPVIYFYPEKALRVSASASFENGRITEWFPAAKRDGATFQPMLPLTWEGDLLPPTDPAARALIPTVPLGKGDHYRHARAVPGAWIFRGTTPAPRGKDDADNGKDADKFVFYRGVGNAVPPFRAQAESDGTLRFTHWGRGGAVGSAFALTVKDGAAHWSRLPRLAATLEDRADTHFDHVTASAISSMQPLDKAAASLADAVLGVLTEAGLTADEARAMVATWQGHWFRETGTRVLAILPRDWVDSVLPLTIQPTPTKLTRVFVARFEVLTQEREAELLALLNDADEPKAGSAQTKKFAQLDLGRFTQGALIRAQQMHSQRMAAQLELLRRAAQKPDATATTALAR
jgi:hypothetical protein